MLVCGSALPSASSIVGLSTPGSVTKTCACAHCGVRGHEEFECPTLFAAVFGEQMPGFLRDGRRDALAWGDDGSITAETALRWLYMQRQGFFWRNGRAGAKGVRTETARETDETRAVGVDCVVTGVERESERTGDGTSGLGAQEFIGHGLHNGDAG